MIVQREIENAIRDILKKYPVIALTGPRQTQTVMSDMFKWLQYCGQNPGNPNLTKTLVYAGTDTQRRTIAKVVPWSDFDIIKNGIGQS